MKLRPFISIIIPVKDDHRRLLLCLTSLEHQTYPRTHFEIIVVDNGSAEDIVPVVSKFPQVKLVRESKQGPAAARNAGLKEAKGPLIAFTDADCIPNPDWLERGVEALLKNPACGLVAGRIVLYFKDPENPQSYELYDYAVFSGQEFFISNVRFGATANLFTRKDVFERVGNFDAETFKYPSGEDADWGKRVDAAGYMLVYAEEPRVLHPACGSFLELRKKQLVRIRGFFDLDRKYNFAPGSLERNAIDSLNQPVFKQLKQAFVASDYLPPNVGQRMRLKYFIMLMRLWFISRKELQRFQNSI